MIEGQKTEAQYRALAVDSSSSLKEFSLDRKKYYKKYILGEKVEETDNKATLMGRLVETILLEPHEFDNRFHLSSCMTSPTGLMLAFVDALYRYTAEATDENGQINRSFEEIMQDAYRESGFKIKYEAVVNKFSGSEAEIYYKEMRTVKGKGLSVVTSAEIDIATKIVETLRTCKFTADIVNKIDSVRWEVFNQLQIEAFFVDGHVFKSMIDKVIVDHELKEIQLYDLKCVWAVEGFYEDYYLYRRAYIQGYLYYRAMTVFKDSQNLHGYKILYPRFIVCDSTNYYSPLVYKMTDADIEDAYEGFIHKGKSYPGVKKLIIDLSWAMDNDIWNVSRDNYMADGLINFK